jgi:hypothetical protein
MPRIWIALIFAAGTLPAAAVQKPAPPTAPSPSRIVDQQSVISSALPRARIEVAPAFRYLGRVPFTIRDVAAGERLIFADTEATSIRRMFVLQFEGYLPDVDQTYRYDFSNAEEIGGLRWRSNAFAYSVPLPDASAIAGEAGVMHDWLRTSGYTTPPVQLMYRFLTLGDERRRDELILFYLEGTDDQSWVADMNGETPRWRARAAQLEKDARQSFRVVSQEGRK